MSETKVRRSRRNNIISDAESKRRQATLYTHNTRKFSFLLLTLWSLDGMLFVLWIKVIYTMEFACVVVIS